MSAASFDCIAYMRKLEEAGVPRQQAETQVDMVRVAFERLDEASRKELVTKQNLQVAMKELELRLLKWQIAGWVVLATIMAKGFGWLGF